MNQIKQGCQCIINRWDITVFFSFSYFLSCIFDMPGIHGDHVYVRGVC